MIKRVHLVLHPHGIAPTLVKIGSCFPRGASFYSYHIHQRNKSDKERKIVRKKLRFMHTKRINTFRKRWVQFHVYRLEGSDLIEKVNLIKF